jgi:hypothetical protein
MGHLEHHLLPFFGTIPITKLTGEGILEYRKLRAGQRVASNAHSALPETKFLASRTSKWPVRATMSCMAS